MRLLIIILLLRGYHYDRGNKPNIQKIVFARTILNVHLLVDTQLLLNKEGCAKLSCLNKLLTIQNIKKYHILHLRFKIGEFFNSLISFNYRGRLIKVLYSIKKF